MLLRFEVANHRSILEPVELSMIAVDKDRPSAREFDLLSERVLTIAGIYGPNASGKSNVVEALVWLSMAVRRSLRGWDDLLRDEIIPRAPFKFGPGPETPSTYEVEMVVGGVRYDYQVELDELEVKSESLSSYPKRQPRILFEREGMEIHFRRGLGSLAGGTRELLTPTTLALSAALRFGEPEIQPFGRHLRNILVLGPQRRAPWGPVIGPSSMLTERMFDEQDPSTPPRPQQTLFDPAGSGRKPPDHRMRQRVEAELRIRSEDLDGSDAGQLDRRESALALLRFADLGIDDVQMVEAEDVDRKTSSVRRVQRRRPMLVHRVAGQEVPFDLAEESAGTRTWFRLIGPALSALQSGWVLLVDEIDASLHPRLSARLLELFQDRATNPLGAQLIFTTHDTSLLNHLNRDEVWLTEKGDNGATTLTALAEYGGDRVRQSLNLEKAYLQGRFGAVPELDQFTLRRAPGLASGDA